MKISRMPLGAYAANSYIVMDENTKDALIIDPGDDYLSIKQYINKLGINLKYIFITHGHADHTGAVAELRNLYKIPVCMNEKDECLIMNGEYMFGNPKNCGAADIKIKDNDTFEIGDMKLKCIETPGHSEGGMCFLIDNVVFTGDTLFQSSIGRTDFIGGNFDTIIDSIKTKLLTLPDETIVLPGHGSETTIGNEKMYNPFL